MTQPDYSYAGNLLMLLGRGLILWAASKLPNDEDLGGISLERFLHLRFVGHSGVVALFAGIALRFGL